MSAPMNEPHNIWYEVEHEKVSHVFEDSDEAHHFVLEVIFDWHGRTPEPDCWPYIEDILESDIADLQGEVFIHKKEKAA